MATWNAAYEVKPTNSDSPTRGDDEIRATRSDARARMENEHLTYNDATAGAESEDFRHREGSARAFLESSEPSNAPSGGTLDEGHLWVDEDNYLLFCHDGTNFDNEIGAIKSTGTQTVAGVKTFAAQIVGDLSGHANQLIDQGGGTDLFAKVISLTFAGTFSTAAAHGLTYSKIRGVAGVPPTGEFITYVGVDATNVTLRTLTEATGQAYATIFYIL